MVGGAYTVSGRYEVKNHDRIMFTSLVALLSSPHVVG